MNTNVMKLLLPPTEVTTVVEGSTTHYVTYKPTGSGPTQGETYATNAITSEGTAHVPKLLLSPLMVLLLKLLLTLLLLKLPN